MGKSEGICTFSTPYILHSMIIADQWQEVDEMTRLFAADCSVVKSYSASHIYGLWRHLATVSE